MFCGGRGISLLLLHVCWVHVHLSVAQKERGDVDLNCPVSSYKFRDLCYSFVTLKANYDDAELACAMGNGHLAIIKDQETNLFIQKLRIRKFIMNYWMGLTDRRKEGVWVYNDNSRLQGFTNWFPGEPNNDQNQHCGVMWMLHNLMWDDDYCSRHYPYVCQMPVSNCTSKAIPFGNLCYELSSNLATYDEADLRCQRKGGALVQIKTKEVNEFIKKLIYDESMQNSWIGLRYIDDEWRYSDGTVLESYHKWGPGEPNTAKLIEKCVMSEREWHDVSCYDTRSFFCQFPEMGAIVKGNDSKKVDTVVKGNDSKSTYERVEITSVQLAFSLIGCIILGVIITFLVITGLNIRRRYQIKPQGERLNDEVDIMKLEY